MRAGSLTDTIALGAMTGMRSMSGAAALARRNGGAMTRIMPVLAVGEMLADKTPFIGNRTDRVPLAGRAFMGAVVGYLTASDTRRNRLAGALIGGGVAVATAHLAYQVRKRLPLPGAVSGLLEDMLIVGMGRSLAGGR